MTIHDKVTAWKSFPHKWSIVWRIKTVTARFHINSCCSLHTINCFQRHEHIAEFLSYLDSEMTPNVNIRLVILNYTVQFHSNENPLPQMGHLFRKRSCRASQYKDIMMTSSNGNVVRVTGPLCGEFTGHRRWILLTKASDAELWCFLRSVPE